MKKRLFSGLLAAALTLCLLPAASAAAAPSPTEMAQVLAALDIMTGNESGDLMLTKPVTRAEFTKLVVAASPMGQNVGAVTTVSPYPDVPYTHWAAPYVEAAVTAGYVTGNVYGYFEPDRNITLKEGVTMVVRLLGYANEDFPGAWPSGQMALYYNQDLDEGISIGADAVMTRQDTMRLFYNLLTARVKPTASGSAPYITTLGHSLNAAGEIDRVGLINAAMKGPVVMAAGWQDKVSFDVNTAAVYRSGVPASLSALQPNDVIYYSKSMRTLWAYSNKITGLYQAVSPNASSPTSVTVAGNTYAIETADAAYALSNLGGYKTGDTVTLLLGRDGGVAAVAASNTVTGTLYGVVTGVTNQSYTDANGNAYTSKTVTFTATDGNTYSYPVEAKSTFKAGNLVQVTTASGGAQIARLNQSSLSGKVNAAGTRLGNNPLAADVEILDVSKDGLAVKLYPSRLAGMSLSSSDVKFYRKNAAGEVDTLILNDATGDIYAYGVLTASNETDQTLTDPESGASASIMGGIYQYDVGGQTYRHVVEGGILGLSVGPVKIEGSLTAPSKIVKLDGVKLLSVDATAAVTQDSASFPVWSSVAVYEQENNTYRLSSLERVRAGYTLTGYYDKAVSDGGCIRVIVARPQ